MMTTEKTKSEAEMLITETRALRLIKLDEIIRGEKKQILAGHRFIPLLLFISFSLLFIHTREKNDYFTSIYIGSVILCIHFLIKLEVKVLSDKIIALKEYLEIKISESEFKK
jgi:hypothetical protein